MVPHELNPRTHSDAQKAALKALLGEIGFARSVLAYEVLVDGQPRLKLIDGHLRTSMDPDAEVDVEVLDVNDAEARALLLAIDPLAQLAGYDTATLEQLRTITEADSQAVKTLWASLAEQEAAARKKFKQQDANARVALPEQFLILVECTDEKHQVALLRKFRKEGLTCRRKDDLTTTRGKLAKLLWQAYLQAYIQHNTFHDKKEWGELLSCERQVLEAVADKLLELGVTVPEKPQAKPPRKTPTRTAEGDLPGQAKLWDYLDEQHHHQGG